MFGFFPVFSAVSAACPPSRWAGLRGGIRSWFLLRHRELLIRAGVILRRVYARKLKAEIVIAGERRAAPLDWLDSFCMRNFTGSAEFDDTLPVAEGQLEAGLRVDPARLAEAMSEWFTKRGKGDGMPVVVEIREEA